MIKTDQLVFNVKQRRSVEAKVLIYNSQTHQKFLLDIIISLKRDALAHKTNFPRHFFIEVPVLSQESERMCACVLRGYQYCLCFYELSIGFLNCRQCCGGLQSKSFRKIYTAFRYKT